MPDVPSTAERISCTQRPVGRATGYHTWSNLLFVHWRVPAAEVQALLPAGLTVDTFDGDAWVGLVPFAMSGIRPWWSPAVPGVSNFLETNVRTYVHDKGQRPGVWFFSLEASSSLAVRVARWHWHLPYYRAQMSLAREANVIRSATRRLWPGTPGAGSTIDAEIGHLSTSSGGLPGVSVPGTLEHFLIERYVLYAQAPGRRLMSGQVHHHPYQIRDARLTSLQDTLVAAAGISVPGRPQHVVFCDGVQVEVFPLTAAQSHARTANP